MESKARNEIEPYLMVVLAKRFEAITKEMANTQPEILRAL